MLGACSPAASLVPAETVPIDPSAHGAAPDVASALPSAEHRPPPPYSPVEGLIIEDLVMGTGEEAKAGDRVTVLYEGTLEDGTVFDSTAARKNEPATFPLSSVIKGWQIGVPGMKVGGKRRLTIAPDLAYGQRTGMGKIPPGSTLIFVIDLVDVL